MANDEILNRINQGIIKNYDGISSILIVVSIFLFFILYFVIFLQKPQNPDQYILSFLQSIPNLLLVMVTLIYVYFTKYLVKINQDLVFAQKQPKFSLDYRYSRTGNHVDTIVYLRNSGDIARNLKITFNPNWNAIYIPINVMSIIQGERTEILHSLNDIRQQGRILQIILQYENIFSQQCSETLSLSNDQLHNLGYTQTIN
jgi:hypothetical protein